MNRAWKYFKCQKCGKDGLSHFQNDSIDCPECKQKVDYDEALEQIWLNEMDENGERIRMDFSGSDEQDCRRKAADFFKCEKEDISNYYIVQKGGLFKKFIICATKPIKFQIDPNAKKIVCWRYENRDAIWLAINTEKKTILYPNELGNEEIIYTKIVDLIKEKDTGAGKLFTLKIEPERNISILFYPDCVENITSLVDVLYDDLPKHKVGIFMQEFFKKEDFNPVGVAFHENGNFKIKSKDFSYEGYMYVWRKDDELCLCNSISRQGFRIDLKQVKYYRLLGEKYVTMEITGGGGGGTSIKGAVIGGLIAGDAGAIIGSRKTVDEVKGTATVHDEQVVLLYDRELKQVVQFNSTVYKIFTNLVPEKDYEVVVQNELENDSLKKGNAEDLEALEKLANLFKKGILTKEEFETKKQDILSRI